MPGGRIYSVTAAGPVVVIVGGATITRQRTTAAFDAASGRPLWTVEGDVVVAGDHRTGLLSGGSPARLTGIDLPTAGSCGVSPRTRGCRWSRGPTACSSWAGAGSCSGANRVPAR